MEMSLIIANRKIVVLSFNVINVGYKDDKCFEVPLFSQWDLLYTFFSVGLQNRKCIHAHRYHPPQEVFRLSRSLRSSPRQPCRRALLELGVFHRQS